MMMMTVQMPGRGGKQVQLLRVPAVGGVGKGGKRKRQKNLQMMMAVKMRGRGGKQVQVLRVPAVGGVGGIHIFGVRTYYPRKVS
jgi:hypothetical protein